MSGVMYRHLYRDLKLRRHCVRCATNDAKAQPGRGSSRREPRDRPTMLKNVERYAGTRPELEKLTLTRFSSKLCRRMTSPSVVYCVDKALANNIAKRAVGDNPGVERDNPVVEVRPGPCVISRALLDTGIPHLRVYEDTAAFAPALQELQESYPAQVVDVIHEDLISLPKRDFADHEDPSGSRVAKLLEGFDSSQAGWRGDPALTIVGTFVNRKDIGFFRYIVSQCLSRRTLFQYGRVKFVLCVSHYLYKHLTSTPDSGFNVYKGSNILLQILFDVDVVDMVPRESFFPWPAVKVLRRDSKKTQSADDKLYVLTIEAKKEIPDVSDEALRELAFFVMYHLTSRKRAIIPTLEQWVPGCGVNLIQQGFSIYSRFGDLTPERIRELYVFFRSLPDYDSCAFKDALNMAPDAVSFPFSLADVSGDRRDLARDKDDAVTPGAGDDAEHEHHHVDEHEAVHEHDERAR